VVFDSGEWTSAVLRGLLTKFGLTQTAFAESIGFAVSQVNDVIKKRKRLSRDMAVRVSEVYGVRLDFLLKGQGQPFEDDPLTTTTTAMPRARAGVTPHTVYTCDSCQAIVPEGTASCPRCGAQLEWEADSES
jgi:transcriptional regulator with XRE-family HTH domain